VQQALIAAIVDRVGDPTLVGLLLGKAAVASERGIELRVAPETRVPEAVVGPTELVTIVGNLLDNAFESVAPHSEGVVEVSITDGEDGVVVLVRDTGPGVRPEIVDEIFTDGFTTKVATGAGRRGLGLALVSQAVRRRGGTISVDNDGGAVFTVRLPRAREAALA
jgi:two-component system CitB family sensor kinase